MNKIYTKQRLNFISKAEESSKPRTLVVKISTPTPDRSKDVVDPMGADFTNFMKNPVVLFGHDYKSIPVAKCTSIKATNAGIIASLEFPDEGKNPNADVVYQMNVEGFLNAWSIGFMPKNYDVNEEGGLDFKEWELLEFSSVPVPDNPDALTIMRSKGFDEELITKGVIPFKETPKAPEDQSWSASEQVKVATVDDLKIMCAWVDSENEENKGAYKLPHHLAEGDHEVVWDGVKAAMGALLGARGGVNIPEGDRKGVHSHLAKHYKQFGKDIPDFKTMDEVEFQKLAFIKSTNDEADGSYSAEMLVGELKVAQLTDLLQNVFDLPDDDSVDNWVDTDAKSVKVTHQKSGRAISAKHEELLKSATDHMQKSMDNVNSVLGSIESDSDPNDDGDLGGDDEKNITPSTLKSLQKALREQDRSIGKTLRQLKSALNVEEVNKK